ncbi:hypothetical protein ACOMHN_015349 [Nucella lapillus]
MNAEKVSDLLNSCDSSNILSKEGSAIRELIADYFQSDSVSDDVWSEGEEESSDDEICERVESDAPVEEDDSEEETIVRVEGGAECLPLDQAQNGQEADLVNMARRWSCGCSLIKFQEHDHGFDDDRNGCIRQFSDQEIVAFQLSVQDMDRGSLDIMIIGILSSCLRNGTTTQNSKRKSGGRKNNTATLTLQDTQQVVQFIRNYAEEHAISLPGRVPGFKRDDILLLPSAHVKSSIYRRYKQSAEQAGRRKVGASTFRKLWATLCPFIVVAKIMTDLCWRCQKNVSRVYQSANLTHAEKQEALTIHQAHLSDVDAERAFYKAKRVVQQQAIQRLELNAPNSKDLVMHYSFDYAQQVHYPCSPAQPGPMYFLTGRKCGVFGVCCEGLPQQVNYLVDDSVSVSKGSNAVVSYLHHFFATYGCGEKVLHLHCDNCSGQNKNKYVLWYLSWRVQTGLHTEISVHFMPSGHTKFAPDWCFGLFKRKFRRSEIHCLEDICTAVTESTPETGVNLAQLVGREDWSVVVPTYDWQQFLTPAFKPLQGIKTISHIRFTSEHPGCAFFRRSLAEDWDHKDIVNMPQFMQLGQMPPQIPAPGLSHERQTYLHKSIREFVRVDVRDRVCPPPV